MRQESPRTCCLPETKYIIPPRVAVYISVGTPNVLTVPILVTLFWWQSFPQGPSGDLHRLPLLPQSSLLELYWLGQTHEGEACWGSMVWLPTH